MFYQEPKLLDYEQLSLTFLRDSKEQTMLQSWTKHVKKTAHLAHIFQSTLSKENTAWEVPMKPSLPIPLTQCCFEGRTISQPFFSGRATLMRGKRGYVVDVSL